MKTKKSKFIVLFAVGIFAFNSCKTIPKDVEAVKPFNQEKYLGKWFEMARLDFKFEKNLNNTTANYSLREDGKIKVVNKGYNTKKEKWVESTDKAQFIGANDVAMLKVSFFGSFYAGYNVIAIDDDYKYALVAGKNLDYLWILSRDITIPENIKNDYLKIAQEIGYKTDELIWVKHDKK